MSCGACHIGRVRLDDGGLRYLDGGVNAQFNLVQYRVRVINTIKKITANATTPEEKIERATLVSLPDCDCEFAEWRGARVNLDHRVEVESFFYSVAHAVVHAEVDLRVTARMIEIFHRGQRVGLHERCYGGARHGTDPTHMPSSHRRYAEWTPERLQRFSERITAAKTQGAEPLRGSERLDLPGCFVGPSVHLVHKRAADSDYQREELFGPDLAVYPIVDMDDALQLADSGPYGLCASLFTESPQRWRRFCEELRAGSLLVCDPGSFRLGSTSTTRARWVAVRAYRDLVLDIQDWPYVFRGEDRVPSKRMCTDEYLCIACLSVLLTISIGAVEIGYKVLLSVLRARFQDEPGTAEPERART